MQSDATQILELVSSMRAAFARGENVMARARELTGTAVNSPVATLIAYDLQAGSYVARVHACEDEVAEWCGQLAALLQPHVAPSGSILEVGCGEATTLAGMIDRLNVKPAAAYGFDISWSRCAVGEEWLRDQRVDATLFVGDLFNIPLADGSIDVVYTSHSLEPNGSREEAALRELLRVARRAVVLVEPIYELADEPARARMDSHGYVRGLKAAAERLGATVGDYRLLDSVANPLNPSGVIVMLKPGSPAPAPVPPDAELWRCPITGTPLEHLGDVLVSAESGIAYPVLRGIPLLRAEHAVVANRLVPAGALLTGVA